MGVRPIMGQGVAAAQRPVVVLAGNIGAGKTTVARLLARELALPLFEESVSDNPFLTRFYEDMPRWVFQLNMYFLASRAEQLRAAALTGGVLDRSLLEDQIFVDLARDNGVTTAENHAVFTSLLGTLKDLLPPPDVLVFLRANPTSLQRRVAVRQRDFEAQTLSLEYLQALQVRYDEWIGSYRQAPAVEVDTDAVALHTDHGALASLAREIVHALGR